MPNEWGCAVWAKANVPFVGWQKRKKCNAGYAEGLAKLAISNKELLPDAQSITSKHFLPF